jgi:hypothetical protein
MSYLPTLDPLQTARWRSFLQQGDLHLCLCLCLFRHRRDLCHDRDHDLGEVIFDERKLPEVKTNKFNPVA